MLHEQLQGKIRDYVNRSEFKDALQITSPIEVQFLAQGEYNLNYLLHSGEQKLVFRVNTGSQMNLVNQIGYEYQALELLKDSGVTPLPLYLDDQQTEIPYGCLVMEYLPGEPLNYTTDLTEAAKTFAQIHSLPLQKGQTDFLVQVEGPFSVLYQEAETLLAAFWDCPRANPKVKKLLEQVSMASAEKRKKEQDLLKDPWRAVINTEVNSHNFIVNHSQGSCHLIDWEKPIYGEPAQDLSMFLIPTTTLWKRNTILTPEQEDLFIDSYLKALRVFSQSYSLRELCENRAKPCLEVGCQIKRWNEPCKNLDEFNQTLRERVESFKFFNLLRAISWCAMAWTEYTQPGRPLVNEDTFAKIQMFLEEDFIKRCFSEMRFHS